jgi:hypothetical protein
VLWACLHTVKELCSDRVAREADLQHAILSGLPEVQTLATIIILAYE